MRRANDVIVGAVVILVSLATIGATLWVKQSDIGSRRERVVARFVDVGNVRVGNAVVIRGVRAGRIEGIELAPSGFVEMRMSVDPATSLPADPVVLLNEVSLFGEWQATITERAALPKDEAVLDQIAATSRGRGVLPGASLPDIAKLTTVAGQIAGDVASVAGRVEVAFDEEAARELRGSIRNFALLSSTLATTVRAHAGDLDTLSTGLRDAVVSLQRTAALTQGMAGRVDSSMTSGKLREIVGDVAVAAAELRQASAQIARMSQSLSSTQGRLEHFIESGDSVMAKINTGQGTLGLLVNDPSVYRHADSLLVQLRALATDVKANPKRYVHVRIF